MKIHTFETLSIFGMNYRYCCAPIEF